VGKAEEKVVENPEEVGRISEEIIEQNDGDAGDHTES